MLEGTAGSRGRSERAPPWSGTRCATTDGAVAVANIKPRRGPTLIQLCGLGITGCGAMSALVEQPQSE